MHSIQDATDKPQDGHSITPLLSVKNLSIQSDQSVLVKQLSFDLKADETLAIVGESGSGKSISSLALLGLLPDNLKVEGEANFAGENLITLTTHQQQSIRGKRIAMIFQEPMTALNPLHRVEMIIGEPLLLLGQSKQQVKQRILALLADVGMSNAEEKLKRYPHELSGGQRQRVMIAAALALDPEILIADEPTTALDVTLQAQVLNLLKELIQKRHMAMILISHDLNLVRRYAENVVVMSKGVVVEQGEVSQVFTHPKDAYTKNLLDHDFGEANAALLDAPEILRLEQVAVKFPIKTGLLNRVKDYFTAVEALDMQIQQGDSIGIVGESGSGKTSLALAVARLISSEGKIVLLGQNLNELNESKLRHLRTDFQMVFQDPFSSLNPRLNVEQIIGEGLALKKITKIEIKQKIETVLAQVELPIDFKTRYPHELSGGQRQRIALARALVLQPQLIILDEPTSALDRSTQRAIVKLLRQLQLEHQLTYVFISHDLQVVKALCQKVLVLRNAEVVEFQDTDSLFNHPQHDYTRKLIAASQY
ncbi:MAG: dipeptide ABC transporter ATP-binding protein [Candidatus Acinetobacter avistercoris]|uniref:ABC transporter ATP-binding protein n=1 Tax=Acinetobacter sp. KS-LM10 TaxID=3120518 RepID=UPI001F8DDCE6|nr:dipeptide ABC transporter ATP-binding protein [Candidatus Acinetobacter avistercoris]